MTPIQSRRAAVPLGRADRLVFAASVGHDTLDACLGTLAPLCLVLGPGTVALFDDGTLTGADRVRLARKCGDPFIVPPSAGGIGGLPAGADWTLLLAALEQRRNAYWVAIGGPLRDDAIPDLLRALGSNRSFAITGRGLVPDAIAPHLDALAREGFPHIGVSPRLLGFAASGEGLALARAVFARLEAALGEQARQPEMAGVVAGFVLAGERDPVLLRDDPTPFIHRAGFE